MTLVNIIDVHIPNNPCKFFDDFQFEITFEVLSALQEELEFKVVYVGSAENSDKDQILQTVMVGPVPMGISKFTLEARCPEPSLIPPSDALGVTVVLLQCSYKGNEFVRVGYYVNNDYHDQELSENPPPVTNFNLIVRSILSAEPRITRFSIPWDTNDDGSDIIPADDPDGECMDVSGEDEADDGKYGQTIALDNGFVDNEVSDNDDDDDEDDIENVDHDLEEDEEKFKQKRHQSVNASEIPRVCIPNSTTTFYSSVV